MSVSDEDSKKLEEEAKKKEEKALEEQKKAEKKQEADQRKQEKKLKEKNEQTEKNARNRVKREPYKMPVWIRFLNLIFGALFIIASIYAVANVETAIETVILILAVILTFSGIIRIINAFYGKNIGGNTRLTRFVIGVSLILLSGILYFDLGFADETLFLILSIGLILQGVDRVMVALTHDAYPSLVKLVHIILGIIVILIGVAAYVPNLLDLDIDIDVLLLIAVGFLFNGIARLTSGIYGLNDSRTKK